VKYKKEKGKLWYIRYPLKDQPNKYVVVATTRPETMLGDTAVAVNPKDKRYKNLIGKKLIVPIVNREVPIISHYLVDPKFGTGAVKITPAHDPNDWKIGKEYKLPVINIIGPDAKMTKEAGEYAGLNTLEARERIIKKLKEINLLEKEEDFLHQIPCCDRCGTVIEPQISQQWFLKMKKLAQPAIKVVKRNKIKLIPERYKKVYLNWLKNIEDWCISRQLWWGHQMPVYYCQNCKKYIVNDKKIEKCPYCKNKNIKQIEDTLDTWFSSALWPFASLGWPKKTKDLKNYYPTNFLSTAPEILYLWVARMIFSSLEFTKKIPFETVYLHSTVLNIKGKRMSKSLGTGVDPVILIDKYGADATRLGIIYQLNRDQQAMKFDERTVFASRNFINKLWNICRFSKDKIKDLNGEKFKLLTLADKWIVSRVNKLIYSITKKIENYQLGEAAREIYDFTWHEFADWYLEISKFSNYGNPNNTSKILNYSVKTILKLLHPFIPFVTETLWQNLNKKSLLMIEKWPKGNRLLINKKEEENFEKIKKLVTKIRNWKINKKIPLKEIVEYKVEKKEKIFVNEKILIENLAKVKLLF